MNQKELIERVETVYGVSCLGAMALERYYAILTNESIFRTLFPGIDFENPRLQFLLDTSEVMFEANKTEVMLEHNRNLVKAWQIALGIVGMTAVMEFYLKETAKDIKGTEIQGMGVLYKFSSHTGIPLEDFPEYTRLQEYYQVRHITMHNLARVDEKFKSKTGSAATEGEPHIFYARELKMYRDLIIKLGQYIDSKT